MIVQNIATVAALITGTMALLGFLRLHLEHTRVHALAATLDHQARRAAEDRAFTLWATQTMLTVTDQTGLIQAATLRQLHTTGYCDRIWDAPIAVSLWHADPDVIDRYTTELDQENG